MTAQSCIFRDVLVVPPLGETPFDGWVAVCTFGVALVAIAVGLHACGRVAEKRVG